MNKIISIFFNTEKTYVTYVEKSSDGLNLLYLNSTENRIDLENIDSSESKTGTEQLHNIFNEIDKDYDRLTITLPAESVFVSKVPGSGSLDPKDIKKLVNFEIRQNFPQFSYEDFTTTVTPLAADLNGKNKMLCVIVPNDILSSTNMLIGNLNKKIDSIEISQLNAHSAFMYNYPEISDKNVVLASVQNQFIDISLSKKGKPAYYNLASFTSKDRIGEVIETEFQKILNECSDTLDSAFFFGNNLDKETMLACWETSMIVGIEAKRLNPFRMMRTELGKREREYCSRTFHLFPPCIGGCLPSYHHRIKLY